MKNDMSCPIINVSRKTAFYVRPQHKNDLKRHGRHLTIIGKNYSIDLDGTQINTIKSILQEAGEIKSTKKWKKSKSKSHA